MTTTFQHPRTEARALTESPLTWAERRRAYEVARFINIRLGQGRSEAVILAQIKQCWPDLANDVLAAARFLVVAGRDGWPGP